MEVLINALYENLEESKLIQQGRLDNEKKIQEFAQLFTEEKREEMYSKLYEILGLTEKHGFSSGFKYGVSLMAECSVFPEILRDSDIRKIMRDSSEQL